MILHLSNALIKRLKCPVSFEGSPVIQAGRLDAWSGHTFRLGRIEHIILMNDASLYTVVFPARGITSLTTLLNAFLPRVASIWRHNGGKFDLLNQEIIVLKRVNRSLIATMNEAIRIAQGFHEFAIGEQYNVTLEQHLNEVPYGSLNYDSPDRLLPKLLAGQ
jgi:hypothetical protein